MTMNLMLILKGVNKMKDLFVGFATLWLVIFTATCAVLSGLKLFGVF